MEALGLRDFSHVTLRVSDLERALAFYRDGLGLRVLFDIALDGPGLEAVTGTRGARGRMVGLLVPGAGKASLELRPLQAPLSVGGVRMFFLADPDGTPIEIVEFPGGKTTSASFNGA